MPQRYPADKLIRLGDRGFWKRFSEAPNWWECEQHFNAKCLLSLWVRFSCSCFCWLDDYYQVNKSPVEFSVQEKKRRPIHDYDVTVNDLTAIDVNANLSHCQLCMSVFLQSSTLGSLLLVLVSWLESGWITYLHPVSSTLIVGTTC